MKVLIAVDVGSALVSTIRARFPEVEVVYRPDLLSVPRFVGDHEGDGRYLTARQREEWSSLLREADVMLGIAAHTGVPITVANAPRLRWIQGTSSGMRDYLKAAGVSSQSVVVTTAAGIHGVPLAEFVALAFLYFLKRVPDMQKLQRTHRWQRTVLPTATGKVACIVGLGHTGSEIARVLSALGVQILGVTRSTDSRRPSGVQHVFTRENLPSVLRRTDLLVLAAPSTSATEGMLGRTELALLKDGAVVVNVSRGTLIDEPALLDELRAGRLYAALDVVRTEPLNPDSPLWDLENVLLYPHSAATAPGEDEAICALFMNNFERYLAEKQLMNIYVTEREY